MIGAIIGHLVGDYLLQNDWMSLNKKRYGLVGSIPCFIHCMIWTSCVLAFGGYWAADWRASSILIVTHFIQDHTTIIRRWMSLIGQDKFANGPCSPWSIIVVDNVWHIVTIFAVWKAFGLE